MAKVIYNYTWKKLYWPDNLIPNYFSYLKAAKRSINLNGNYDAIIAVGLPFTSVLVAHKVSKMYNIPLIIDIGDPFAQSYLNAQPINNPILYKKLNFKIERKIFTSAKTVFVTNENIKALYEKDYELSNVHVLPPLFYKKNIKLENNQNILKYNHEKINIVFIGSLNSKIRNPEGFLKYIVKNPKRNKIKLHIIGNTNDCLETVEKHKKDIEIEIYGRIDKDMCDRAMLESDVLLNIGNNNSLQLPSKLADYISVKKKIVNYSFLNDDLSTVYLKEYPYAYLIEEGKKYNYDEFNEFVFYFKIDKTKKVRIIDEYLKNSSKSVLAKKVMEVIER